MPDKTYMRNVNMSDDPAKERELRELTNENADEQNAGTEVESVLGSVHISKPSIERAFFLFKPLLNPLLKGFSKVETELSDLVNELKIERLPLDRPFSISQNVPYVVDYRQRKRLYLLCQQPLTLVIGGNQIPTVPGYWTPISLQTGAQIYALGVSDAAPMPVIVRACDTPMLEQALTLDQNFSGVQVTEDLIRYMISQGKAFRVATGQVATGAANAWIGLQGVTNNLPVNVIIYNIMVSANASTSDVRLYQNPGTTIVDPGLTQNLLSSIANQKTGAGSSSQLSALNGSPAATTQANPVNAGNIVADEAVVGNSTLNVLTNGSLLWLPKGAQNTFGVYAIQGTSGNKISITLEWIEF